MFKIFVCFTTWPTYTNEKPEQITTRKYSKSLIWWASNIYQKKKKKYRDKILISKALGAKVKMSVWNTKTDFYVASQLAITRIMSNTYTSSWNRRLTKLGWGDDSAGKRTWVYFPSTHIKSQVWPHMPLIPVLSGANITPAEWDPTDRQITCPSGHLSLMVELTSQIKMVCFALVK